MSGLEFDLSAFRDALKTLFAIDDMRELGHALNAAVMREDTKKFDKFCALVPNLETDWLQAVYQYYVADRTAMKQDFTPGNLALFMARLVESSGCEEIVDMCAGSGALSIQAWNLDKTKHFILYEADSMVIPFLLFNLAVRNMRATVHHADILKDSVFSTYHIRQGNRYGSVEVAENDNDKPVQQPAVQPEMDVSPRSGKQCTLFAEWAPA